MFQVVHSEGGLVGEASVACLQDECMMKETKTQNYILCPQIGFPFLWPVYNLLHHSYIIQVKDTCIQKVGVNGGSQTGSYVFGLIPFLLPM